jgi:hypothetical protein
MLLQLPQLPLLPHLPQLPLLPHPIRRVLLLASITEGGARILEINPIYLRTIWGINQGWMKDYCQNR